MVLSPAKDPIASDPVDSRLRSVRKSPIESDKLGAGPNALYGITNSIAVKSQVVVSICDDDIMGYEELGYVLVEDVGGLFGADIVTLRMREAKEMCEGNCNSRFSCSSR